MKANDFKKIIRDSEKKTKSTIDCGPSKIEICSMSYSFDDIPDNHPLIVDLLKRINSFFKDGENV